MAKITAFKCMFTDRILICLSVLGLIQSIPSSFNKFHNLYILHLILSVVQ